MPNPLKLKKPLHKRKGGYMTENVISLKDKKELLQGSKTFEIFKGEKDEYGKVKKTRALGQARIYKGSDTYHVFIKTLLNIKFFLLPEKKNPQKYEYVILTREISHYFDRKYYWNVVGEGRILMGQNEGLMELSWYFFGNKDVYSASA